MGRFQIAHCVLSGLFRAVDFKEVTLRSWGRVVHNSIGVGMNGLKASIGLNLERAHKNPLVFLI